MENTFDIHNYNKNEFRIITAILILYVLQAITAAANENARLMEWYPSFEYRHITFSNIENYLLPCLFRYLSVFAVYAVVHFYIERKLVTGTDLGNNILYSVLLFAALTGMWMWTAVWIKAFLFFDIDTGRRIFPVPVYVSLFLQSLVTVAKLTGVYALYLYLKHNKAIVLTLDRFRNRNVILRDCYWATGIWLVLLFMVQGPAILALPIIPVYAYLSVRLIPLVKAQNKGFWNYFARVALIATIIGILVLAWYALLESSIKVGDFAKIVVVYAAFHVFIVAPITWAIYHYRLARTQEITGLKTALGQSSASLDFLRSQINPHFLFNALNTLYGTAIQENAERTGEGIQKLGDMMRFMLDENVQEKISLMREVDYLKNYIDLQKLRTQSSPDIQIQTEIEESVNGLQIAPMLLIPFIENAFKHGISLREPSQIKTTLHTEGRKLFFDVYNTVRPKNSNDPEKDSPGIGLENVKQRLQLLYTNKHELIIRQTAREYFVHLTIEL